MYIYIYIQYHRFIAAIKMVMTGGWLVVLPCFTHIIYVMRLRVRCSLTSWAIMNDLFLQYAVSFPST